MKYLGIIIGIITFILGVVLILGTYKEKVDNSEKINVKQDEWIERNNELDVRQTYILEKLEKKL